MGALTSPGGLAVVGVVLVLLIGVLVLGRRGGGTAARDALVKRGRYGEAARMAADAGDFAVAFDLYLRAQEPENAAAIAVKRGDLRQAAELYERAANWERAVHFYQRAGMGPKADDLRAAHLAPAPAPRPRGDSDAPRSRAHELEARYRQAASAGATTDAAKVELQRQARDAADALLAEGELARAAEIYADAGLEDEAVHLYVNVLGQPGRAAPLVARRGNHQRAAELYELAGELERAAVAWVDVAKGSPRPDSFLERIGELSPKVALGYVEQELGGRPLSKATAEWHYQRAKLTAAGGDAARAQAYFEQLQAIVGPYRDVEERLRGLALPAPAPAPRAKTMQGPGSNLDPTQIELLASQVAEAAAQQLKRRVELSALPEAGASPSHVVRTEIRVVGLEQAPLVAGLLDDSAVHAARHGVGLDALKRFTGGRPCDLGNIEVYYRIGLYYLAHGNYDDALAAFDAVEDTSPATATRGSAPRRSARGRRRWARSRGWPRATPPPTASATSCAASSAAAAWRWCTARTTPRSARRRAEVPVRGAVAPAGHPRAVPARGARGRRAQPPQHRHRPRHRLPRRAARFMCMELVDGQPVEALIDQARGLTIVECAAHRQAGARRR
jgi:tetratricopeptide (TPR) repeat protein